MRQKTTPQQQNTPVHKRVNKDEARLSDSDLHKSALQNQQAESHAQETLHGSVTGSALTRTDLKSADISNTVPDQYRIDKRLLRRAMDRSIDSYEQHAQVFDEIANRLTERLDLLNLTPKRILDLGTGNGKHLNALRERYPKAVIVGADISTAAMLGNGRKGWQAWWWRYLQPQSSLVCMDAGQPWPFADETFDLVISNMLLPWISETDQFATELARVLATGGAFFISSVGPDTLIELRQAWQRVDPDVHVNAFLDMHDVGDMFARAGLADPVMDTERIEVRYRDVESLLTELEATGCTCVVRGRRRGLMSRQVRQRIAANYPISKEPTVDGSDDNSSICASLELVVAHGWKQVNPPMSGNDPREQVVRFQAKTWQSQL